MKIHYFFLEIIREYVYNNSAKVSLVLEPRWQGPRPGTSREGPNSLNLYAASNLGSTVRSVSKQPQPTPDQPEFSVASFQTLNAAI